MQIELIDNPLILPKRNAQRTTLALHDYQENHETKSTEEQIRLLSSWRAVLGEIESSERGAGRW
jgi:hypothetical protein